MTEYLAVAPHAWAREGTKTKAVRSARRNVPSYVSDKRVFTILEVESNDDGEFPYVDDFGFLRVPEGSSWKTIFKLDD